MSSANKLYNASGTDLPFKEWLRREQLKGKLDVHNDTYLNMDGEDDEMPESPEENPYDDGPPPPVTYTRKDLITYSILGIVAGMLISKYIIKK